VVLVGGFAAAFKFRLLTRAELVCVAFAMMMAVPMMTQGFWHRFLGITSAPLRNASFDYLDAYHDNLWHSPQKLRSTRAEDRKRRGSPAVKWKRSFGKVSQATAGAPAARRQLSQWQRVGCLWGAVAA
jgi:hypothetical protein